MMKIQRHKGIKMALGLSLVSLFLSSDVMAWIDSNAVVIIDCELAHAGPGYEFGYFTNSALGSNHATAWCYAGSQASNPEWVQYSGESLGKSNWINYGFRHAPSGGAYQVYTTSIVGSVYSSWNYDYTSAMGSAWVTIYEIYESGAAPLWFTVRRYQTNMALIMWDTTNRAAQQIYYTAPTGTWYYHVIDTSEGVPRVYIDGTNTEYRRVLNYGYSSNYIPVHTQLTWTIGWEYGGVRKWQGDSDRPAVYTNLQQAFAARDYTCPDGSQDENEEHWWWTRSTGESIMIPDEVTIALWLIVGMMAGFAIAKALGERKW